MSQSQRLIDFENCRNFRHVGGYEGLDGAITRPDRYFRSSHLANINWQERERLLDLGVASVIDLRRASERVAHPNALPTNIEELEVEIDVGSTRYFFQALQKGTSAQATHDMMAQSYASYVTEMAPQFASIFNYLADGRDGGVLVHCMVGKDRTGIATALLLTLLGVHRDVVVQDYLLSNEYYPADLIVAVLQEYLEAAGVKQIDPAAMTPFCTVHPDYLVAAFAAIEQAHGGTELYFTQSLGLSQNQIQTIRQRFLQEAS